METESRTKERLYRETERKGPQARFGIPDRWTAMTRRAAVMWDTSSRVVFAASGDDFPNRQRILLYSAAVALDHWLGMIITIL